MAEPTAAYPKYLDWLRYLSACLLFTYALSKLLGIQFTLPPEMALRPVGSLTGHQLTWYYYSYSHAYANILGLTQLAGGAMLLFRKTALLGAAMMLPVIPNILMAAGRSLPFASLELCFDGDSWNGGLRRRSRRA